jgi:hypothetical protein
MRRGNSKLASVDLRYTIGARAEMPISGRVWKAFSTGSCGTFAVQSQSKGGKGHGMQSMGEVHNQLPRCTYGAQMSSMCGMQACSCGSARPREGFMQFIISTSSVLTAKIVSQDKLLAVSLSSLGFQDKLPVVSFSSLGFSGQLPVEPPSSSGFQDKLPAMSLSSLGIQDKLQAVSLSSLGY